MSLIPVVVLPTSIAALVATAPSTFTWPTDTTDPLAGVVAAAGAGAWVVAAWWTLAAAISIAQRLPGRLGRASSVVAARVTPIALRGLVGLLSGVAVAGTAVGPAVAAALPVPTEPATVTVGEPVSVLPHKTLPRSHVRVVRPGESLWSIAHDELGDTATAAATAQAWPRWWAANRGVIGDDPSALVPGERLVKP